MINHEEHKLIMSWLNGIVLSVILLFASCAAVAQSGPRHVIIVKSNNNSYYDQTIQTLTKQVKGSVEFSTRTAQELNNTRVDSQSDNFYIALGQAAVEAVNRLDSNPRALNTYLTQEQFNNLQIGERQLTILLDQPLHRYLAFSKLVLGIDRIGVITPRKKIITPLQTSTLKEFELTLNQHRISNDNKFLPVLRNLLQQDDALLMLPQQNIYNRDTLKAVLLTSYRSRKPVVSYSPAHVKSGAVASIYSSPADIGRHLALLLGNALENKLDLKPGYLHARYYSISMNSRVARALDIVLPDRQALRARLDRLNP